MAENDTQGDIIVTATRRSQALSDVPLAVSAVTAETLANSGASDLRQLNQLSPSLLVSSTTSDAGGGVARIRGIGTVGDNPGLESSVALFIDGVYRSRTATGLSELGAIDRIEVLRGPQGTLFGRNASAGLIHVITAKPSFEEGGTAELSYGNYDYWRGVLGLTGPINQKIAYRIDGVYVKRDGFLHDVVSGRDLNDRDRWMARGQLLFEPSDGLSLRLIGDYSRRKEECCGAVYLPTRDVVSNGQGGFITRPSSIASAIRGVPSVVPGNGNGIVLDTPSARQTAITPGRSYRQDVRDWGVSGEVNYDLGDAALTSITAYRDNRYIRGQDSDFNNLDILYRPDDGSDFIRFRTFSQEVRLQGDAFDGKLDWLVGGYFANEKLDVGGGLRYGADYDAYATASLRVSNPLLAAFPGFGALNPFVQALLNQQLAAANVPAPARPGLIAPVAALVPNLTLSNTGPVDRYRQDSRNYALFTHNVFNVTDRLAVTVGARYTNERKTLDATFNSTSQCGLLLQSIGQLRALGAAGNTLAAGTATQLAQIAALPCVINSVNGTLPQRQRKEGEWSGTAVLSYKPLDALLVYASYSRGYKAGGFNLDRSVLNPAAPDLNQLQFEAEKVNAYEVGAKLNLRGVAINVAAFQQDFRNFQLNNFQGVNFIVENINGCSALVGGSGADSDTGSSQTPAEAAANLTGACAGKVKSGVRSRGVEIEAFLRPAPDVDVNLGFTLADTRYRDDLVGANGRPLPTSLVNLPGQRVSNSSLYTVTGGAGWTPPIGSHGLHALVYADFRYQSDINTGSDLFYEKRQDGVTVVNARLGLRGADDQWSLEFWGQNLLDTDYTQVAFSAPTQGVNDTYSVVRGKQSASNRLYGAFLAEPRTYGLTVRTKF